MAEVDGAALRILREKDGWAAKDFAEHLKISKSYLSDIEQGRRTLKHNPGLISRMADALNVPKSMIERRYLAAAQLGADTRHAIGPPPQTDPQQDPPPDQGGQR